VPPNAAGVGTLMRTVRRVRVGLLCAVAVSFACVPAVASGRNSLGLLVSLRSGSGRPVSYFRLHARAGERLNAGRIVLANDSARPLRVVLDRVDAQTINTLGSTYRLAGAQTHGSTRWLRLSMHDVTLDPGGQASVAVAVNVSRAAKPEDYLSGVSIEVPARFSSTRTRGTSVLSSERIAIGVEILLPGRRHPLLQFTGARVERQPAGLTFLLDARNPGNSILQATHGWARVTRAGRLVAHAAIGPGTFVTGTAIAFPVAAPGQTPTPGTTYQVAALLRYHGGTARLNTTVTFGRAAAVVQQHYGGPAVPQPVPWWRSWQALVLAGSVLLCCVGLALVFVVFRRRRRSRTPAAAIAALDRALASAAARGEPLSIIALTLAQAATAREIAPAIRPRLRRADHVHELAPNQLLIISPATNQRSATALCSDLRDRLGAYPHSDRLAVSIATATTDQPISATQLLDQLAEPALLTPA
jgi:hypothetical protein